MSMRSGRGIPGSLRLMAAALVVLTACGTQDLAESTPTPQEVIDVTLARTGLADAVATADSAFVGVVERLSIEEPVRHDETVEGDVVAWVRVDEVMRGEAAPSQVVPVLVYREYAEGVAVRVDGEVVDRASANLVPEKTGRYLVIGFEDSEGITGLPGAVLPTGGSGIGLVDSSGSAVAIGEAQGTVDVDLPELMAGLARIPEPVAGAPDEPA